MPTSSILHNIVISDPKKAEALANALEASSQNPKCKPSEPAIPILTDVEAVREFFLHRESAGEEVHRDKNTKNILVVLGGGRPNGNTKQLADAFAKGAADAGHNVEIVSLNKVEVKGCLGCNACRYGKPCVQKDGFNELMPAIKSADLIVFASPLLFWTISSKLKAFIERFYCIAEEEENPPYGRYEKYPVKDAALLMTSADDFFWTYEQAVYYCKFAIINYIGFNDKGMLLAGGCGDTNGKPQIDKTNHLAEAYQFGKNIYAGQ